MGEEKERSPIYKDRTGVALEDIPFERKYDLPMQVAPARYKEKCNC
jgi:hypothetical protein